MSTRLSRPAPVLCCGRFTLALDRPMVMGVLNLTPDSFSDGGRWTDPERAVAQAQRMIDEGADLIDLGAESTRPGAPPVPVEEELRRLLPIMRTLRDCGVPLSIDTRKPEVMRAVLDAGADMINDVAGFTAPGAIDALRGSSAAVCTMHMLGDPQTMQQAPHYADVVVEVRSWLADSVARLRHGGIDRSRIVVDPGFGFGKTVAHNYTLLARLRDLGVDGLPMLVGVSRKSMIGAVTGRAVGDRLAGSVAAMLEAVDRGAAIVRVHDVAATRDALAVRAAVRAAEL